MMVNKKSRRMLLQSFILLSLARRSNVWAFSSPLFVDPSFWHRKQQREKQFFKYHHKRSSATQLPSIVLDDVALDLGAGDAYDYSNIPAALYATGPKDHRYSASDWFHNIRSLGRSSILREIRMPVLSITLWSTLVSLVFKYFKSIQRLDWANRMCISSKPHSLIVSALGLLLVFRTNSAYQRFTEGRKIWESILSISRNMTRMINVYPKEYDLARKKRIFRLLAAFPYLLRHHIQPQCSKRFKQLLNTPHALHLHNYNNNQPRQYAKSSSDDCIVDRRSLPWCLLPPMALEKCSQVINRPLWACDRMAHEITQVAYNDNYSSRERLALLGHVDKLSKSIGECERIHQTAVPLNYARHSLRSLTLWLWTLPFGLLNDLGLLVGPVMGAIAWLLLGVYQIGYSIEDPFQGSLRLGILCDAIYRDVMYGGTQQENPRESAYDLAKRERSEWDAMDDNNNNFDNYRQHNNFEQEAVHAVDRPFLLEGGIEH